MADRNFKPDSGYDLVFEDAGSTDRLRITDGGSTILYEDGGAAALTIDTDGNAEIAQNIEQADGKNIQTDEVRARDGDGLKLYDDGGNGIFIQDGDHPKVNIGATSPVTGITIYGIGLHIKGSTQDATYAVPFVLESCENDKSIIDVWENHSSDNTQINLRQPSTGSSKVRLHTSANSYFMGGNIGIGDSTPSYQLELSTDSAAKPSTNTWTVPSDERLKENIENADLDICYNVVKNLPLKRYKWRDDVYSTEKVRDRHKIGWIAQDVESVFPKAVNQYDFKFNQVFELDEDGKEQIVSEDVIEDCRGLNADQIYAVMFGAIQKLQTKVEALENA